MASHVLNDVELVINSVDLSDHATSVELNIEIAEQDNTAFGNNGFASALPGLKTGSMTVNFNQDFAASSVDATLFAIQAAGVPVTFSVKPTTDAISATNPAYTGNCTLYTYNPIAGSVGEVNQMSVTFRTNGEVTRDITP
jgi:hypothetical protein